LPWALRWLIASSAPAALLRHAIRTGLQVEKLKAQIRAEADGLVAQVKDVKEDVEDIFEEVLQVRLPKFHPPSSPATEPSQPSQRRLTHGASSARMEGEAGSLGWLTSCRAQ